jgi:DNA polymerase/3'-5' exonuclease PolX
MSIVVQNQAKIHRWVLWFMVKYIAKQLRLKKYQIGGSYRRGKWWCNDIDLLIPIRSQAEGEGHLATILKAGWKYTPGRQVNGYIFSRQFIKKTSAGVVVMDVFLVPPGCWGNAMLFATGPKSFNDRIRKDVIERGYSWADPKYFTHMKSNKKVSFDDEVSAMDFLDIGWIPPKDRK